MKIGSVVICCYEFDKTLAFWQEALHFVPREPSTALGQSFVILKEKGRTFHCSEFWNGDRAKEVDCISTCTQPIGRAKWSGLSASVRLAILGATDRALTSLFWKTPMAISSA